MGGTMNWTELLSAEVEHTYDVTDKLLDLVDDDKLGWKPETGSNWMTAGQLLKHISEACGTGMKGFVTGDWGMPPDADPSAMSSEDMLPPAEKLPTLGSVAEAKKLLAEDKALAVEMIAKAGEDRLANEDSAAPWDPRPTKLGHQLLSMVVHLQMHKAQLFYYLKLQGKPVNTGNLW